MPEAFLHDVVVVELGDRLAVGACGSLLAQLGATVVLIEDPRRMRPPGTKWDFRPLYAAGKKSLQIMESSAEDHDLLQRLIERADVVLMSTDMQSAWIGEIMPAAEAAATLICDLSAFGRSGPLADQDYSDVAVQAIAGAMDTTGAPDGPPIPARFPIMEYAAAAYATAGILAGLKARRDRGISQRIDVALHDVGINMLSSFLAAYLTGGAPRRIGNHHPSMSPWNLYRTKDGWVLICAGSDEQWRRMCQIFKSPALIGDARFASPTMRVRNHVEIDQIVEGWTTGLTTADCIERLNAAAIACGPVSSVSELFDDASALDKHGAVCQVPDPTTGIVVRVVGSLFQGSICEGRKPLSIPRPDADRALAQALAQRDAALQGKASAEGTRPPLAGVRVVEVGNYTTAPLVGRQLGALGAYVVKVEAPGGDLGRSLPPVRDGQGYFFTLGNSDKRSIMLDLRTEADKSTFRNLLGKADILIENLKVGSLGRLGFSEAEIARVNPRLVHCATTGFGTTSPYANRAAMDTTIQGMAGIMDLIRGADGVPYKTGISIADLIGGQFGLIAVLAGLAYRDRTGRGQFVDLSMHAVTAWLTQTAWNPSLPFERPICLIQGSDGYVVAGSHATEVRQSIAGTYISTANPSLLDAGEVTRRDIVALLSTRTIRATPVLTVKEAAEHPQTVARNLIITGKTASNVEWPLLACPIRYAKTTVAVQRAIGPVGSDKAEICTDWALDDGTKLAAQTLSPSLII